MFFFCKTNYSQIILSKSSKSESSVKSSSETIEHQQSSTTATLPTELIADVELLSSNYSAADPTQFTCDYIGSIVLNLLCKLVREETTAITNIDRGSVTLQSLHFAVDAYRTISTSSAFRPVNQQILQRRLVTIQFAALRNVCLTVVTSAAIPRLTDHLDIGSIFDTLLSSFGADNAIVDLANWPTDVLQIKSEHVTAAVYLLLTILLKELHSNAGEPTELFDKIHRHQRVLMATMQRFALSHRGGLTKCLRILFRLIRKIRCGNGTTIAKNRSRKRIVEQRRNVAASQRNICTHHHRNTHELGCVLERVLLGVAEQIPHATELTIVFRFFHQNAACCCNNTSLAAIGRLLATARTLRLQRACLNFVKNNILKSVYSNVECAVCDATKVAFYEDDAFVRMYRQWMLQLGGGGELTVFLKHIAKCCKHIPFDVSCKIIADVVLPPFRQEKRLLLHGEDSGLSADERCVSRDIIVGCLNVFLCYLRDVRLIKGFFNDENIQHMDDLIVWPEFASLVCCLLKVGIENASFLGENCGEQLVLSEKLRQLKCQSVLHGTEVLIQLFDNMGNVDGAGELMMPRLRKLDPAEFYETIHLPNRILARLHEGRVTVLNVLHLAVVYWNMILQLMRVTPQSFFTVHQMEAVITVAFNSLSCFLHHPVAAPSPPPAPPQKPPIIWIAAEENEIDLIDNIEQNIFFIGTTTTRRSQTCDFLLPTTGFCFVYDIRGNCSAASLRETINRCGSLTAAAAEKNVTTPAAESAVKNLIKFVSDKVLDRLFTTTTLIEEHQPPTISGSSLCSVLELRQVANGAEYKKLFLQLFEITCGVMMSCSADEKGNGEFLSGL